jgi:hypothetical protein
MAYIPLGWRRLAAAADLTGYNAGQLTNAFTPQVINVTEPIFEIYKISIGTATPGQTFQPAPCSVLLNGQLYTATFPAGITEWDPTQPMQLRTGDEVDFCWGLASSVTPVPVVTCWLRYDPALRGLWGAA